MTSLCIFISPVRCPHILIRIFLIFIDILLIERILRFFNLLAKRLLSTIIVLFGTSRGNQALQKIPQPLLVIFIINFNILPDILLLILLELFTKHLSFHGLLSVLPRMEPTFSQVNSTHKDISIEGEYLNLNPLVSIALDGREANFSVYCERGCG